MEKVSLPYLYIHHISTAKRRTFQIQKPVPTCSIQKKCKLLPRSWPCILDITAVVINAIAVDFIRLLHFTAGKYLQNLAEIYSKISVLSKKLLNFSVQMDLNSFSRFILVIFSFSSNWISQARQVAVKHMQLLMASWWIRSCPLYRTKWISNSKIQNNRYCWT